MVAMLLDIKFCSISLFLEISFTMNGSNVAGGSVLLSWRLSGIRGWSNIVLERILTTGTQETLLAVAPNIEVCVSQSVT